MRTLGELLADTYAFVEALSGNPRYERILRSPAVVTTANNVQELHYALCIRGVPQEEADRIAGGALARVVEVPASVALDASRTRVASNDAQRRARSKLRMSHVDAWGYAAAQALGLKFLTGDPIFRKLPGVEFVR
jgi:hypothetical protein